MDRSRHVEVLPPSVSRRIAAGEVIERPASVVRELIDNSLDAGAGEIDITWSGGGAESLRVRDNGWGLGREDLELCWHPHATSKIRSIEDLEQTRSLGFRGEALASIAAVSTLTITSALPDAPQGYRLTVEKADNPSIVPAPPTPGTTVEVIRLFANLPARRRFLSRSQAETTAIRNTIRDKALPFPQVRFTAQSENGTRTVYPAQDLVHRIGEVYGSVAPIHALHQIDGSGEGFSLTIVTGEPALVRRDRRYIRTYVNKRRVWEYKLIQAVEYAYQDVQHGGLFPVTALFVDIDPSLVDFNIHPAKREVRIRPSAEVHHRIVETIRSFLRAYTVKSVQFTDRFGEDSFGSESNPRRPKDDRNETGRYVAEKEPGGTPFKGGGAAASAARRPSFQPEVRAFSDHSLGATDIDSHAREAAESERLVYRGTVFDTYIIVEIDDRAYLIDQHAAHERLLYNHLQATRATQPLLVAEEFDVTEDQDGILIRHRDEYHEIGIGLEHVQPGRWRITSLPPEYSEQIDTIIETIIDLSGLQEGLDRVFLAELACKAAVKGGDFVDGLTALEIARRTLALDVPRCPHGRPLWVELTRRRLDTLIGRV